MAAARLSRRKGMDWFKDRTAVVTGAASGLGRGIALALAEAGCHLVIADVDAEGLDRARDEIERMGRECLARRVDVSSRQDLEDLTEDSLAWRGGVDLLVNNAGVAVSGELDVIPVEDIEWIIGVNLMGELYGCRFFLPHMVGRGEGHIVNIASLSGLVALPLHVAYTVTKFGVVGLSELLWAEARNHGVGVTVVCPGAISTNIGFHTRNHYRTEKQRVNEERYAAMLRERGMDPREAGRKIVEAVADGRFLVLLGREAYLLYYLKRLAPTSCLRVASFISRRLL
ncbi:MAG: SDR family NAD(P)-dependent oxidoreductase [Actinomycetota bacterium]